jgi:hypothetical protein
MTVDISNGQQTIATTRTRISLREVLVQSAIQVNKGRFLDIVFGNSPSNVVNAKFQFENTDGIDMETKHLDPSRNYVSCQGNACSYCEQHRLNSKVYTPHTRYYFPVMFQNAYYTWEIDQKFFSTFANLVKFGEVQEWQIKRTRTEHGKPRYTMKLVTEQNTPCKPLDSTEQVTSPKIPEPSKTASEPAQKAVKPSSQPMAISLNIPDWQAQETSSQQRAKEIADYMWNSNPLYQYFPESLRTYLKQIVNAFPNIDWSSPEIQGAVDYHITSEKPGYLNEDISHRLITKFKEIGAIS